MQAKKLKEILANIPDNTEILLWNGFVLDWQDVGNIQKARLFRISPKAYQYYCTKEKQQDLKDPSWEPTPDDIKRMKADYKKYTRWEVNNLITAEDISSGRYLQKVVTVIDAKERGVTTFDRMGDVSY